MRSTPGPALRRRQSIPYGAGEIVTQINCGSTATDRSWRGPVIPAQRDGDTAATSSGRRNAIAEFTHAPRCAACEGLVRRPDGGAISHDYRLPGGELTVRMSISPPPREPGAAAALWRRPSPPPSRAADDQDGQLVSTYRGPRGPAGESPICPPAGGRPRAGNTGRSAASRRNRRLRSAAFGVHATSGRAEFGPSPSTR